jgi:hypothetical protein
MFKILSWFIGLVVIILIIIYGWTFIKDVFAGNPNWITSLNSGNVQLIKDLNNPSATPTEGLLDRLFPGVFPLFKIQPENLENNTGQTDFNYDEDFGDTPPQEVIDYVREVQAEAKYPNVNYQNNQIDQVIREVNFGKY